jgi:RNA polymerase sigma-70 factor, ECF subfamily
MRPSSNSFVSFISAKQIVGSSELAPSIDLNRMSKSKLNDEASRQSSDAIRVADHRLVQMAVGGDPGAFEQIYWQHHRTVYYVCLKMIKDAATAEDLTQQVFLSLFRKMASFRGESKLSTWLHRTTVNQVLMHIRSQKAIKEAVTEDGSIPEPVPGGPSSPGESPIDRLMLEEAVGELPNGYREIFVLHDFEGFEHDEIADMLGCAPGTSKSQLSKARRKLRVLLGRRRRARQQCSDPL